MQNIGRVFEEVKVQARDLVDKVKELIHEGNVRRVIIKDDHGATFVEIPLTVATVSVILAPVLAAVGATDQKWWYNDVSGRFHDYRNPYGRASEHERHGGTAHRFSRH